MVTRRELIAGGAGAASAGSIWGGKQVFDWLTRNPDAPQGDLNLTEVDGDAIDWETEVESGGESVFYQLTVSGPDSGEDSGEELLDTGMPKGRSKSHSGSFEPDQRGIYQFELGAQTDTYDRVLDESEVAVFGPFQENETETGDGENNLSYGTPNLPYSSIEEGLFDQNNSTFKEIEDLFSDAYRDRDEDVDETVEDAFLTVDGATTGEYLEETDSGRDDIDVILGFRDGGERTKLRGHNSLGTNRDFEEYVVGLKHLNRFDDEVDEFVGDYIQDFWD